PRRAQGAAGRPAPARLLRARVFANPMPGPDRRRRRVSAPQWPPEGTPRVPSSVRRQRPVRRGCPRPRSGDRRPARFVTLARTPPAVPRDGGRPTGRGVPAARRDQARRVSLSVKPGSTRSSWRATGTLTALLVPSPTVSEPTSVPAFASYGTLSAANVSFTDRPAQPTAFTSSVTTT